MTWPNVYVTFLSFVFSFLLIDIVFGLHFR